MTGRPLVEQLLGKNHKVRIIVRSSHKLPADILENPNTTAIENSVLDSTDEEITEHVMDSKEYLVNRKSYAQTLREVYVKHSKRIIFPNPQNLFL